MEISSILLFSKEANKTREEKLGDPTCDFRVELAAQQGEPIRCHSRLLKMVSSLDLTSRNSIELNSPSCNTELVSQVLNQCCYGCELTVTPENAANLLKLAQLLQLTTLRLFLLRCMKQFGNENKFREDLAQNKEFIQSHKDRFPYIDSSDTGEEKIFRSKKSSTIIVPKVEEFNTVCAYYMTEEKSRMTKFVIDDDYIMLGHLVSTFHRNKIYLFNQNRNDLWSYRLDRNEQVWIRHKPLILTRRKNSNPCLIGFIICFGDFGYAVDDDCNISRLALDNYYNEWKRVFDRNLVDPENECWRVFQVAILEFGPRDNRLVMLCQEKTQFCIRTFDLATEAIERLVTYPVILYPIRIQSWSYRNELFVQFKDQNKPILTVYVFNPQTGIGFMYKPTFSSDIVGFNIPKLHFPNQFHDGTLGNKLYRFSKYDDLSNSGLLWVLDMDTLVWDRLTIQDQNNFSDHCDYIPIDEWARHVLKQ